MCTPTRIPWNHVVSPSRWLKLSYTHSFSTGRHHFAKKIKVHVRRPARTALPEAVNAVSKSLARAVHHVKAAGPRSASSTIDMERDNGQASPRQPMHRAMIAFGSNIGDRVSMIEQACEKMPARAINVKRTSLLYETAPMYVLDQDAFYNGVCEVRSCYLATPDRS